MNIAFYAPMKPPNHPSPSGDRHMARLLMQALKLAGHAVSLATVFRSYDRGDVERQLRIQAVGEKIANRLIAKFRKLPPEQRPHAWFTYHLYHKAPDWIGPRVAKALSIPYLVAEASFAPKQAGGVWDLGHRSAQAAIGQADLVLSLNPDDEGCVVPFLKPTAQHSLLPAFIDTDQYGSAPNHTRQVLAARHAVSQATPWLLTTAMMRRDQKQQSYEVLAAALATLQDRPWHLFVAGSGPAQATIQDLFGEVENRVTWLGFQDPSDLKDLYAAADIFVWPAIKEAFGMVFLEAQSSGLPVIAGASAGVASIVQHNRTGLLTPQGDAGAFAKATACLLDDAKLRTQMSAHACSDMTAKHGLDQAAHILQSHLQNIVPQVAA